MVEVAGTSATSPVGDMVSPGDPYARAVYIPTRSGRRWPSSAPISPMSCGPVPTSRRSTTGKTSAAHGEAFGDTAPASTFVEISRLMAPGLVVEFEATAIVSSVGS